MYLFLKRIVAGFGERAEKTLKPAIEIIRVKVSRARCDKEITLPKRVRIDLDNKLIALRARESSFWSSGLFRQSQSYSESWWAFSKVTLSPIGNSFSYIFKGRVPTCF